MKTEKDLYNYIKRECKKKLIGCYKLHCESKNGWPDIFLIYKGQIVLAELKSPAGTGRISPAQKIMLGQLMLHGAEVYIVESKKDADVVIAKITL